MNGPLRRTSRQHYFHSSQRRGEGLALSVVGSQWMADKWYVEPKELEYLEYKHYAEQEVDELMAGIASEELTSMSSARNQGVEHEWEVYQLFAELEAPPEVFRYVDDEGNVAIFSESELEDIRTWSGQGPYPVSGIEGHHVETVRENPDNLELAASPDNILLATEQGHREHLHGGVTTNPTQPGYAEENWSTAEMLDRTLEHHHNLNVPGPAELGVLTIGGSALLYTTVSLMLESGRLMRDPRPWVAKRALLYRSTVSTLAASSILATAGFGASISIEGLLSGFSEELLLSTSIDEIFVLNGAFAAVTVTAGIIKYTRDLKHGVARERARAELKRVLTTAASEAAAFQALGLGAEVLAEMAGDAALDLLIPDPTGVVIAARAAWGGFKLIRTLYTGHQNKQAYAQCKQVRLQWLREQAITP